jgi:hypothetical protein
MNSSSNFAAAMGRRKMPAKSEKQRKFMGMELGKKRAGKGTKTGMSEAQLSDFAKKPKAKGRGKKPAGDMAMLKTMKMPA